jgi:hypothetical protein
MQRRASTFRVTTSLFAFVCVGLSLQACDDTRRNWSSCREHPCDPSQYCNAFYQCEAYLDAGAADAGPIDAPVPIDGPPLWDGGPMDGPMTDASADVPMVADVAQRMDGGADATVGSALDATVDATVAGAIDAYLPDAPGTCAANEDCPDASAPLCLEGRCVACVTAKDCKGSTPVCSAAHACVSCAAVDAGCPADSPMCEIDTGRCVECLSDAQCTGDSAKSFCRSGTCVGCGGAGVSACATRNPNRPACLAGGTCVECAGDANCGSASKPICDLTSNSCKPCASDLECAGKPSGPGVCLVQDGHCASDEETIFAGTDGAIPCSETSLSAGTRATPYCTLQTAVGAAKSKGKTVVLATGLFTSGFTGVALAQPLTIVGKSARITPASYSDGIGISAGELYLRGLTITGSSNLQTGIGINAQVASGASLTLHLDGVSVTGNPGGGILLGGAAFDIRNTSVVGNGPGQTTGGAIFGGIRVDSMPAAGPTNLSLVTLQGNAAPGLSCAGSIQGTGVLASDNAVLDIAASCGITACSKASDVCGAQ